MRRLSDAVVGFDLVDGEEVLHPVAEVLRDVAGVLAERLGDLARLPTPVPRPVERRVRRAVVAATSKSPRNASLTALSFGNALANSG